MKPSAGLGDQTPAQRHVKRAGNSARTVVTELSTMRWCASVKKQGDDGDVLGRLMAAMTVEAGRVDRAKRGCRVGNDASADCCWFRGMCVALHGVMGVWSAVEARPP